VTTLSTQTVILAPPERCFDLARSVDLHAASASVIHGKATAGRTAGLSESGDRTTWSARFFGMRFLLTTEITAFDRPRGFSDVQRAGLFRHFGHVYTFTAISPTRTVMTDVFSFRSPFGSVGAAFDAFVLRRRMRAVMEGRALHVKRVAESEEWREYLQEDIP
jgi:ligand-binding SRPBCC domain-containing protein